jgi:dTMP kinase
MFIVLDGPDGSGTSFHALSLAENLKNSGKDVFLTMEPTDGPVGTYIRTILTSHAPLSPSTLQLLFVADRADHQSPITNTLNDDKVVICDRYWYSTVAYGIALGLDSDWLKNMNKIFIQPDHVFFTLPPYDVCKERLGRRRESDMLEEDDLQTKVYAAYEALAKDDSSIAVINTSGDKEEVSDKILAHVYR